jgi:gliding motility-associated-like protein
MIMLLHLMLVRCRFESQSTPRMKRKILFTFFITCLFCRSAWAQNLNIVSIIPQANAVNVAANANISITFDLTINAASLSNSSIVIRGSQSGVFSGVFTGGGTTVITFNPDNNFRSGETVSVTITRTVSSQSGFNLSRGHTYSFTAVTGLPPVSPPTFAQRRVNFTSGSSTTDDISAVDFDKDGDLDIIVGRDVPTTGQTDLWENDGNMGFCRRIVGQYKNVEVHDIDGDGDLDSFGPGGNGTNLNWYRNEGDGGAFTQMLITTTNVMWAATGGDLDSDGDIDAVAMTLNGAGTSSPKWFANNGAGVFTLNGIAATVTSGVETETYLYLADINTDGAMDILAYRDNTNSIILLENNGSEVFTERTITTNPDNQRLSTADLDGDGDLDILSTGTSSVVALSWYENDGSENFILRSVPLDPTTPRLYTVEATDVDGDLDVDLVAGGYWFDNNGSENFTQRLITPGLPYAVGSTPVSFGINHADMDNDGDIDILTLGYLGNGFRWQENVRLMNATGNTPANAAFNVNANSNITVTFDQPISSASITANSFRVMSNLRGLINGTFSGGGTNTITFNPAIDFLPGEEIEVAVNEKMVSLSGHRLELNHGFDFKVKISTALASPTFTASPIMAHTTLAWWMDVADMDGDGDMDVVSCADSAFYWHRNDGSGNFNSIPITTSASPRRVFATDYDYDGNMDVIMQTSGVPLLYLNDGNENFSESQLSGLSGAMFEFADVDRDGDADAVAGIRWLDRNCDAYSIGALPTLAGTASSTTAGDLDNDGDIDLFRSVTSGSSFLLNDGYVNYTNTPTGGSLSYTDLVDLDGDGDLDILGVQPSTAIVWYDNNLTTASQNFGARKVVANLAADPKWVVAADFDGDGDLDVAAISRNDDKIVWYSNQLNEASANFGVAQNLPLVSDGPILINAADMNGDGKMDLVVLSNIDNELNWFANNASVSPTAPTITYFTPTSGVVGATVNITGTNFSTTPGSNTVRFNGTTSTVTASTATSITTTVPAGASTGKITVTVAGNTATSATDFTVSCGLVPTITSFSPGSGSTGAAVTINGTNFSTTPGNNLVEFNGTSATVTASTATTITTTVPAGASTGPVSVTVACNTATSAGNFTIVVCTPAPTITSFSPAAGDEGTLVTITGTNFSATPADNIIDFNGVPAIVTASTTTSITTTVPAGATTGPISITLDCNYISSAIDFTIVDLVITTQPSDVVACKGDTATFTTVASGDSNISYQWQYSPDGVTPFADVVDGGNYDNSSTSALLVNTTGDFGAGRYRCLITSDFATPVVSDVKVLSIVTNGCGPQIANTALTTQPGGKITLDLKPLITTVGTLDVNSIAIVEGPPSGALASVDNGILTVDYSGMQFAGTESVTIEACNTKSICAQQEFSIEVVADIVVYNAVSPNGDDKNAIFRLEFIDLIATTKSNTVSIYNRWGDEVFLVSDYDNTTRVFAGFNKDGNKLPAGIYYYKIFLPLQGKTLTGFLALRY